MYSFGNKLEIEISGESHSEKIGGILRGFPKGFKIDFDKIFEMSERRKPKSDYETSRAEPDKPVFVKGIENGVTTGDDIEIIIENLDKRMSDYEKLKDIPRPGHADFAMFLKDGQIAPGGGRFSGRMTAPLCVFGSLALQYLEARGIVVGAHAESVGGFYGKRFDPVTVDRELLEEIKSKKVPVIDEYSEKKFCEKINEAKNENDSVGGVIECAAVGYPAGVGDALFSGLDERIASAVFAIPAVKGIEFGIGFASSDIKGSENNDCYITDGKNITTETNNCGGICGGVSNGMPIIFRVAVKPTPSISKKQRSVNIKTMENTEIEIAGRHDACIVFRCVPVVESICGLVLADMLL